jgi:transposase
MTTSKSPRKVLLVAYNAARESLPVYAHRYAPKKFTQHQLFACLVLKAHQQTDYRGITQMLRDLPELRSLIGLQKVPHYTTLQKAAARLLKNQNVDLLLEKTIEFLKPKRRRIKHAAADSTGLETHHASRYFIWRSQQTKAGRTQKKQVSYRKYGKLMILVCCATHMILAGVASAGPTPDVGELRRLMQHVSPTVHIDRLVADAGFDSAGNHCLLRDEMAIASTIPPRAGRPTKDPTKLPTDRYRRMMRTRFNAVAYRKRSQVETVMSMIKRNLGDCLRGRTYQSRRRDMLLMMLTHNIAIVLYLF